jgi:hypothetical protein
MKSIFASMIVALFAVSVSGKDGQCIFRVHAEAHANTASSVPALFSGKHVAVEQIPRLSERDVVAFLSVFSWRRNR